MTVITTDYTKKANPDTYPPGALQGYRVLHWLRDILMNFCSDPINIKDDRLCGMFSVTAGEDSRLDSLFRVGVPFNPKSVVKAGTTPAILVSITETSYPLRSVTLMGAAPISKLGGMARYKGQQHRTIKGQVAVITESYDGTLLLENLIEDFLLTHELELVKDCGMISEFHVLGSSGPQEIAADAAGNAKQLFQSVIQISMTGGVSWISDTQGPVFRGISACSITPAGS